MRTGLSSRVSVKTLSMKMILRIGFCLMMLPYAVAAEHFVCISKRTAGFKFDGNTWIATQFRADQRYLIDSEAGTVREFSSNQIIHEECGTEVDEFICSSGAASFILSLNTKRFSTANLRSGFLVKQYLGTPAIEIGTCSNF